MLQCVKVPACTNPARRFAAQVVLVLAPDARIPHAASIARPGCSRSPAFVRSNPNASQPVWQREGSFRQRFQSRSSRIGGLRALAATRESLPPVAGGHRAGRVGAVHPRLTAAHPVLPGLSSGSAFDRSQGAACSVFSRQKPAASPGFVRNRRTAGFGLQQVPGGRRLAALSSMKRWLPLVGLPLAGTACAHAPRGAGFSPPPVASTLRRSAPRSRASPPTDSAAARRRTPGRARGRRGSRPGRRAPVAGRAGAARDGPGARRPAPEGRRRRPPP